MTGSDPDAIRAGMESWAEGTLSVVDGAEHELLMERPDIRTPFLARAFETFEKARVTA